MTPALSNPYVIALCQKFDAEILRIEIGDNVSPEEK